MCSQTYMDWRSWTYYHSYTHWFSAHPGGAHIHILMNTCHLTPRTHPQAHIHHPLTHFHTHPYTPPSLHTFQHDGANLLIHIFKTHIVSIVLFADFAPSMYNSTSPLALQADRHRRVSYFSISITKSKILIKYIKSRWFLQQN